METYHTKAEAIRKQPLFGNPEVLGSDGQMLDADDWNLWHEAGIRTVGDIFDDYGDVSSEMIRTRLKGVASSLGQFGEVERLELLCSAVPRAWKQALWDRPLDVADKQAVVNPLSQLRLKQAMSNIPASVKAEVDSFGRTSATTNSDGGATNSSGVAHQQQEPDSNIGTVDVEMTASLVPATPHDPQMASQHKKRTTRLRKAVAAAVNCSGYGPMQAALHEHSAEMTAFDYWACLTAFQQEVGQGVPEWAKNLAAKQNASSFLVLLVSFLRLCRVLDTAQERTSILSLVANKTPISAESHQYTKKKAQMKTAIAVSARQHSHVDDQAHQLHELEQSLQRQLPVVSRSSSAEANLEPCIWTLLMIINSFKTPAQPSVVDDCFSRTVALVPHFFPAWCHYLRHLSRASADAALSFARLQQRDMTDLAFVVPLAHVVVWDTACKPRGYFQGVQHQPAAAAPTPDRSRVGQHNTSSTVTSEVVYNFGQWESQPGNTVWEASMFLFVLSRCHRWAQCSQILHDFTPNELRFQLPWVCLAESEWTMTLMSIRATRPFPVSVTHSRCCTQRVLLLGFVLLLLVLFGIAGVAGWAVVTQLQSLTPYLRYLIITTAILVFGLFIALRATNATANAKEAQAERMAEREKRNQMVATAFAKGGRAQPVQTFVSEQNSDPQPLTSVAV